MGFQRSSDMTLKQYAAHIRVNLAVNHNPSSSSLNGLYRKNTNNENTPSISSNSSNGSISQNPVIQIKSNQNINPMQPQQTQPHNMQNFNSFQPRFNHRSTPTPQSSMPRNSPSQNSMSQILIAPISSNYPLVNNTNFVQPQTIPLNAATLQSLGINIPTITSINPGQHFPTTFHGQF